jgi:urease accessory protein
MHPRTLLRLLQLSDTAFPTGSFSHSMALEAFAEARELGDAEDLARVIKLHLSALATSDCVALRAAHGETSLERLFDVDRLLAATKLARELRAASSSTGKRFLLGVAALGVEDTVLGDFTAAVRAGASPGNLAVGYGVAGPALGLGVEETLHAYLYATVACLVAAGQKLVPLGGSAAQRVLYELGEDVIRTAETGEDMEVEEMHAFSPTLDVRSMMHERQRTRLYIS